MSNPITYQAEDHSYGKPPPEWDPLIPVAMSSAPPNSSTDVPLVPALDPMTGIFVPTGFVPAPGSSQGTSAYQSGASIPSPSHLPSGYPISNPLSGGYQLGVPPGEGGFPPPRPQQGGGAYPQGAYPQPPPEPNYGVHPPHSTYAGTAGQAAGYRPQPQASYGFQGSNPTGPGTAQQQEQIAPAGNRRRWTGGLCEWCHPAGDVDGYCLCCLTSWCSCISFGRTMERAGFGGSLQCSILYVIATFAPSVVWFLIFYPLSRERPWAAGLCIFWPIVLLVCFGLWAGYHRSALRKKYQLHGDRLTDCILHTCCHWCTLCQEYRTISINVHDCRWKDHASEAVPAGPVLVPPQRQSM